MNPYKLQIGQRVVVNTRDGDALDGIVRAVTGKLVELGEAHLINRTGRTKLDGPAVKIPTGWIAWIQVVS